MYSEKISLFGITVILKNGLLDEMILSTRSGKIKVDRDSEKFKEYFKKYVLTEDSFLNSSSDEFEDFVLTIMTDEEFFEIAKEKFLEIYKEEKEIISKFNIDLKIKNDNIKEKSDSSSDSNIPFPIDSQMSIRIENGYIKSVSMLGGTFNRSYSHFCKLLNMALINLINISEENFMELYCLIKDDKHVLELADIIRNRKIKELNKEKEDIINKIDKKIYSLKGKSVLK